MNLRENWRILMLVAFVLASAAILFGPFVAGVVTGSGGGEAVDLDYGLELSGGTRIRAPLIGLTATEVEIPQDTDISRTQRSIAGQLDVSPGDVQIRPQEQAVEVYSDNVTRQEFASALNDNGFDVSEDDIRQGVTQQTRETTVNVLNNKINEGGLTGGGARTTTSGTGQHFVVVEVPNADREEVLQLIGDRGQVGIVAHFPEEQNGSTTYREVSLLTNEDFTNVGPAQPPNDQQPQPHVSVSLERGEPAENYTDAMNRFGFTAEGIGSCPRDAIRNPDNASGYCLYTVQDGRVVYAASMSLGLAEEMRSGNFVDDPTFVMTTTNMSDAQQLSVNLRAGALPTELDIDSGTSYFLQPSIAERFKSLSVVAGLVAWFAVSGVVFIRYGSPRVAVPMLATAAAEVFLLLGFASVVGLALDLSHIAGFIAVIGTGVDDLVIIADEILQQGKVATGRVFQNRFRKAFWVIGAAAATTIIAMSPLTVLSLGDLTGFAIVTIVGVLLGVLVTRPAYGDILRKLMLSEEERERYRED